VIGFEEEEEGNGEKKEEIFQEAWERLLEGR